MRMAVVHQNQIVAVTNNVKPIEAARFADKETNNTGRDFVPVDRNAPSVIYQVYEIDSWFYNDRLSKGDYYEMSKPENVTVLKINYDLLGSFAVK